MKILITGGFGFIGTHLTRHYLGGGHSVSIMDNLSTGITNGSHGFFSKSKNRLSHYDIDLGRISQKNSHTLKGVIEDSDLIYHLASPVGVKYLDSSPHRFIIEGHRINANVFPLFEEFQKKIVFISSSEVYGESEDAKETDSLKIGSPEILRWGYACNKLMGEFLLKSYTFPSVIVRPFNITGHLQSPDYGMVLPSFIHRAGQGQNPIVYNTGEQIRSFCDIRDAVPMMTLLGENDEHNGEIYNLGNPSNTTTIMELAELVVETFGGGIGIDRTPYSEVFTANSQDIHIRKPNTDKISKHYQCRYDLRDIISSMVKPSP